MKILLVYASTEGQTAKIAGRAMDWLSSAGHSVAVAPAGSAKGADVASYDAVIVAGSVHIGEYQKPLRKWARRSADILENKPTLFLSVSLAAAGDDPEDWKGLKTCVQRFCEKTGWTPGRVEHVAGAFRFSQYDFFRNWAMRWIASTKNEDVTPGKDKEYTDWPALEALLKEWTQGLSAGK